MACVSHGMTSCFSLSLVCWGTSLQFDSQSLSCSLFPFPFYSSSLSPKTFDTLKTAWLLLVQANNHILELSPLFHLFAACLFVCFSVFLFVTNQGPLLCLASISESRPVSTRQAPRPQTPQYLHPPKLLVHVCVCSGGSQIARDYLSYIPTMVAGALLWVSVRLRFREEVGVKSYFLPS